jgi:hypothetical protein
MMITMADGDSQFIQSVVAIHFDDLSSPRCVLPSIFHQSSINFPSIFHQSSITLPSVFHQSSTNLQWFFSSFSIVFPCFLKGVSNKGFMKTGTLMKAEWIKSPFYKPKARKKSPGAVSSADLFWSFSSEKMWNGPPDFSEAPDFLKMRLKNECQGGANGRIL